MEIFGYTIIKTFKLDRQRKYQRSVEEHLANVIASYADENNDLKVRIEELEQEEKRLQHDIIEKDKELRKWKKR